MVDLAPAVRLPGQDGGPLLVLIDTVKRKRVRVRTEPAGGPINDMQSQFHGNYGNADGDAGKKDGSCPALAGSHTSTIKASGDFTAQIATVKPGDPVAIQAPFGRFSHVFYPEEQDLVFIAGGIGITPLMSNLRHLRDTGARRRVLLLYSNRGEADIVFKEELDRMAGAEAPQVEVVHILTRPDSNWPGESGRLDREKLRRLCGDRLGSSVFLLCCPPPMIQGLVASLRELGVPMSRISYEYFSL